MGQVGLGTDAEHRLHELITTGSRDVVEAIEAVGDMLDTAPVSDLAELDDRHLEVLGVACRDVAVLIEGSVAQSAAVGVSKRHDEPPASQPYRTRYGSIGFSAVTTVP